MLTLISCPDCGVPAEVTDRFRLSSTAGPVEHVALNCVVGHYFRMPADMLSAENQALLAAPASAAAPSGRMRPVSPPRFTW